MKHTEETAILVGILARKLPGASVAFLAGTIAKLAVTSRSLQSVHEWECNNEQNDRSQKRCASLMRKAAALASELDSRLTVTEVTDPRAGSGLALHWGGKDGPLPGNSFGGDTEGYRL